jgi:hypothetical protein
VGNILQRILVYPLVSMPRERLTFPRGGKKLQLCTPPMVTVSGTWPLHRSKDHLEEVKPAVVGQGGGKLEVDLAGEGGED